jgi:hypothetical protein
VAEFPTGTVTFLFTDLEGSTRAWEEQRTAMAAAVDRHDDLLEDAIARHGGVVFSRGGDGMAAAFPTAVGAVAAAVDAQLALASEVWGETGALRARMGIHTGEGRIVGAQRDQYESHTLNRCARGRCCVEVDWPAANLDAVDVRSDGSGEFGERGRDAAVCGRASRPSS